MDALQGNIDNLDKLIDDHLIKLSAAIRATKDPKQHKLEGLNKLQYACSALDGYITQYWILDKVRRESSDDPLSDIVKWKEEDWVIK